MRYSLEGDKRSWRSYIVGCDDDEIFELLSPQQAVDMKQNLSIIFQLVQRSYTESVSPNFTWTNLCNSIANEIQEKSASSKFSSRWAIQDLFC